MCSVSTEVICMLEYVWDSLGVCKCRGKTTLCVSGFCAPKTNCHLRFDTFQLNARGGAVTPGATQIHPTATRHHGLQTGLRINSAARQFCKILYTLNSQQLFLFFTFYLKVVVCKFSFLMIENDLPALFNVHETTFRLL